jgi:hypothetical protein
MFILTVVSRDTAIGRAIPVIKLIVPTGLTVKKIIYLAHF